MAMYTNEAIEKAIKAIERGRFTIAINRLKEAVEVLKRNGFESDYVQEIEKDLIHCSAQLRKLNKEKEGDLAEYNPAKVAESKIGRNLLSIAQEIRELMDQESPDFNAARIQSNRIPHYKTLPQEKEQVYKKPFWNETRISLAVILGFLIFLFRGVIFDVDTYSRDLHFSRLASNKIVPCSEDKDKAFQDWIENKAGALLNDYNVEWANSFTTSSLDCGSAIKVTFTAFRGTKKKSTSAVFAIQEGTIKEEVEEVTSSTFCFKNGLQRMPSGIKVGSSNCRKIADFLLDKFPGVALEGVSHSDIKTLYNCYKGGEQVRSGYELVFLYQERIIEVDVDTRYNVLEVEYEDVPFSELPIAVRNSFENSRYKDAVPSKTFELEEDYTQGGLKLYEFEVNSTRDIDVTYDEAGNRVNNRCED